MPKELGQAKRLKVLRLAHVSAASVGGKRHRGCGADRGRTWRDVDPVQNCVMLKGIPVELLRDSPVSLLTLEGNPVQERDLQAVEVRCNRSSSACFPPPLSPAA